MTEIFTNVSDETKKLANTIWNIALAQKLPIQSAEFLNNCIEYYKNTLTEEEIEFLHFYFRMKMEMMKQ